MCGFAGYYNLQRRQDTIDTELLNRMQERIAHRGPDGKGVWKSDEHQLGLAARRLSIIDLSDAGSQPMYSEKNRVVVCFNGEIYNHQQLAKELQDLGYQYNSTSDTETIINAYRAWGIKCLERFEGMFAIALFDFEKEKFYLVRDRIGVKPLYFSLQGGVLSFASEIKALWELPWIEKKLSDRASYHYLTFMVAPAPLTIFEGIYKLPAGFYAEVDQSRRASFSEWYSPLTTLTQSEKKSYESEDFCVERIRQLLIQSTQKRMVSDVPVGAYLSGGLDSSLNVALMSRFSAHIKTFTVAFADDAKNNEFQWAERVAKQFGTDHHELVISEKEAFEFYQRMVEQLDEPLADCVCIPFYYVSKLARDAGMKVVQVGEGADELFFGYPAYARYAQFFRYVVAPTQRFLPAVLRKGFGYAAESLVKSSPLKAELFANWRSARAPFWGGAIAFGESQKGVFKAFFGTDSFQHDYVLDQIYPGMQQELDSHAVVQYHLSRLKEIDPTADFGKQMLYLELKQRLPELLLMRADKMSMAASIEAREPFLDHKLVEFMLNVPEHLRFKNKTTKYLLKKAAEGILPNDIIYRPKIGFAAPTFQWLEHGRYFPKYFKDLERRGMGVTNGLGLVNATMNKNVMHRAVQNWVLQQLWAFAR